MHSGAGRLLTAAGVLLITVSLAGATGVSVGTNHACAILADGRVGCWGSNGYYVFGNTGASRAWCDPALVTANVP